MRMAERWLCIRFLAQPSMVLSARQATAAAHPGHSLAHGGAVFAVRFFQINGRRVRAFAGLGGYGWACGTRRKYVPVGSRSEE
ncbi:hypothetical protein, partial [Stenotrophomonas nematodicola]